MDAMAEMPDKAYNLAICDPPYGIKQDVGFVGFVGFGGFGEPIARRQYKGGWDNERPDKTYFDEVQRVSETLIIWGGNFFADLLPQGKHWLVWDKLNTMPTFGDCELAWTNVKRNSVKKYELQYNGLLGKEKIPRIHPTQKPVKLYEWLLKNYAKPGDKILDTHLGSGSIAIACYNMGYSLTGYEIDKDYYEAAITRLEEHKRQGRLFIKS